MKNGKVVILWDGSYIWGLMALRAARALGLRCRLAVAQEITHALALGKGDALLLVPGGAARQKARALGSAGLNVISAWLASGGSYLGFCGGAGFALRQKNPLDGLGVCSWTRASYAHARSPALSGYVYARAINRGLLSLPVWWPARFEANEDPKVRIIAVYASAGEDCWLGDKPYEKSGKDREEFPAGQPLVIAGGHGEGKYLLSYAHLETPDSPDANLMLADILRDYFGLNSVARVIPAWDIKSLAKGENAGAIAEACEGLFEKTLRLIRLGEERGVFCPRLPWLPGWRGGEPGMAFACLLAGLSAAAGISHKSNEKFWRLNGSKFIRDFNVFFERSSGYLREWTVGNLPPLIRDEKEKLFGHPMLGGGLIWRAIDFVYELIYRSQKSEIGGD